MTHIFPPGEPPAAAQPATEGWGIYIDPARQGWPGFLVVRGDAFITVIAGTPPNCDDSRRLALRIKASLQPPAAVVSPTQPTQDIERWRTLYRAVAWMVNDYIGVCGISADFTKKHKDLGYAHEGYHNARIVIRENKPPVPEGMQQGIRCECWSLETGQFAGTRHEHYDEPPYRCARCGCKSYTPSSAVVSPREEPKQHTPPAVHHLCGPNVIGVTGPPHASWCWHDRTWVDGAAQQDDYTCSVCGTKISTNISEWRAASVPLSPEGQEKKHGQ